MKTILSSFGIGILFALGLGLAGMTLPEKVIGFLDVFGSWDPSLMFVMAGALIVHTALYRLILKRPSPLWASKWHIPKRTDLNLQLFLGAALFGIGWGLAGYCPAPVIVALSTFNSEAVMFVASMLAGMLLYLGIQRYWTKN